MEAPVQRRGPAAVSWLKGTRHKYYEDSFRMLPREVPLVGNSARGELYAIFDGIGTAPEGRHSAQEMADALIKFYRHSELYPAIPAGLCQLLHQANMTIHDWGLCPGRNMPLGGCAGTVVWIIEDRAHVFHAGDTCAMRIRDGEMTLMTCSDELADGSIGRYFGEGPDLQIHAESFQIEESDRILIMSDGVLKACHPLDAAKIVDEHWNIEHAVKSLTQQSRVRGSEDDITSMLIEVDELMEAL